MYVFSLYAFLSVCGYNISQGSCNVSYLVHVKPSMISALNIFLYNIHCLSATQQGCMVFQRIPFTNLINSSININGINPLLCFKRISRGQLRKKG